MWLQMELCFCQTEILRIEDVSGCFFDGCLIYLTILSLETLCKGDFVNEGRQNIGNDYLPVPS